MKPFLQSFKPSRIIPLLSNTSPLYAQTGSFIPRFSPRAFRAGSRPGVYSDSDNREWRGRGKGGSSPGGGEGFSRNRGNWWDMDEEVSRRGGKSSSGRSVNMRSRDEEFSSGSRRGGGFLSGRGVNMRNDDDEFGLDEGGYWGSRGGGRFGGRDSMSRFERESRGGREMGRGERSSMGRGGMRRGERVQRRDFALLDGQGDKDGVGRRGRRTTGMRKENPFAFSDDDGEYETDEDDDDELGEDDDDEIDEEEVDVEIDEEEDGDLVNKESVQVRLQKEDRVKTSTSSSSSSADLYLSETRFDKCSVSPLLMKALKDAGYEKMTVVQEATLPVILKGKDVLAKASTGTGTTLAFLLPSINVVEKTPAASCEQHLPPIPVLVICSTRELAHKVEQQAIKLLKYHPSLSVQLLFGGRRLSVEQKRIQAKPCQIIVATPGRLKEHIENTAGFTHRLRGIKLLVLDEVDYLLDMGFRKDIEGIIDAIPKQRQTLLFSATIPLRVKKICLIALKKEYEYINTVHEGSEDTRTLVRQTHLVAPLDNHFPLLYTLLKDHIADNLDYKVLVFCTTDMVTVVVAEFLKKLKLNVREIHSRRWQINITRASDEFRKSKGLILVNSDGLAPGRPYPDVTLVVQLGLPADEKQYIRRLRRTGRKDKEGVGVLLLAPWEEFFLSSIKDMPITKAPVPLVDPESKKKVEMAMSRVDIIKRQAAYRAWLAYYNGNKTVGSDKSKLVDLANKFSRTMELDYPPPIRKNAILKMKLQNVRVLRSQLGSPPRSPLRSRWKPF